jgi:hypothetical protein
VGSEPIGMEPPNGASRLSRTMAALRDFGRRRRTPITVVGSVATAAVLLFVLFGRCASRPGPAPTGSERSAAKWRRGVLESERRDYAEAHEKSARAGRAEPYIYLTLVGRLSVSASGTPSPSCL